MRILIIAAMLTSTAFAAQPGTSVVWCRAYNQAGTKWWYSSVFPQPNGKSAKDSADDWKAWLDGEVAKKQLKGFNSRTDTIAEAQCHVEPRGSYYAQDQRNKDKASHNNPGYMLMAFDTQYDPRGFFMYCVAIAEDPKEMKNPRYSDIFEIDSKTDKSQMEYKFELYLDNQVQRKFHSGAICYSSSDKQQLAADRSREIAVDSPDDQHQAKEIHWPK